MSPPIEGCIETGPTLWSALPIMLRSSVALQQSDAEVTGSPPHFAICLESDLFTSHRDSPAYMAANGEKSGFHRFELLQKNDRPQLRLGLGSGSRPYLPAVLIIMTRAHSARSGWEVYPHGLKTVLEDFSRVGLPLLVTENGIATDDESLRGEFVAKHLQSLAEALDSGVECHRLSLLEFDRQLRVGSGNKAAFRTGGD